MLDRLLARDVGKRPATVRLQGRVLFLTEDPELIRRQLAGEDLDWDPSIPLRNDISTDEITPGWVCYYYDEMLGQYPYVGLLCQGEHPVGKGDVIGGGFVAAVSGKRRGKGSSREAAPYAERILASLEPYLLNASLTAVVSQLLIRKLCTRCRTPASPSRSKLAINSLARSSSVELGWSLGTLPSASSFS